MSKRIFRRWSVPITGLAIGVLASVASCGSGDGAAPGGTAGGAGGASSSRGGGGGATGSGGAGTAGTGGDTTSGGGGAIGSGGGGAIGGGGGATGEGATTGGGVTGTGGGVATGAGGGAATGTGGAVTGAGGGGGAIDACARPWVGDIQTGTALDDEITAVTAIPGGGFYVTGYERGDDNSTDVIPAGDARAVIARYDGQGVVIWKSTIDTSQADTAEDIQVDPATGNLIVAGRTSGALPGFQNAGQMDMYVAVLNSGGDMLGAIQIGDERPQHPVRLGLGPNNKILVAGYDDIFIPSNYVAALSHGFLAQLTAGSAPTFAPNMDFWHRSALFDSPPPPPSNEDFTTGVAVDATGDVYVSSTVDGRVDVRGMFLTKFDAAGQTIWSTRLSADAGDFLAAVGLSPNGDLFVAGAGSAEIAGVEVGQQDAFVAKVDKATGAVLWATLPGSPESDYPTGMTFDAAGNIYLTGQTLGTIAGGAANQGGVDIFAAKIGPSGGILSSWERGSAGDDFPAGIAVDGCGRVFVGGFTTGALVAGQPNAGGRDMFLVKAELR